MIAKPNHGALRSAFGQSSIAAALLILLSGAAWAQTSPSVAAPPTGPGVALPQIPPPSLSTKSSKKQSVPSAPLATSASDCKTQIGKLQSQRMAILAALSKIAKANKGKLDPVTACPKFRTLVSVETRFRNYLETNKDWCGIPGQVVDTVAQSTAKDAQTSVKACRLAVQFKKAQQQAAQGGLSGAAAPTRLPAGPL